MKYYSIPVSHPVEYHMSGKFESLTPEWKHEKLNLDDYELFVVTGGVLYIEYNDTRYRIEKGEMLFLPPVPAPHNTRKGYQSSACTFYWLHFGLENSKEPAFVTESNPEIFQNRYNSGEFIDLKQMDYLVIPAVGMLNNPEKIIILMKQLQDAERSNSPKLTLNYMATSVMCKVFDDIKERNITDTARLTRKQLYNDILDYVKHNLHSPITVQKIATKFGYNEKYLSQMFKAMSGETLKQYIINRKIEEANFLLSDTNLTIAEIAGILGYSDNHNFMRGYKKVTGMSPTEYRNAFAKRVLNH